ncbi:TPM domain-containing protein [Microvirga sp. 2MCAF38]|uniref:TPM domain-containing protein n=1 Tax=Microvirga sp. 2MCAF38 TaxID=3232989 RepID=UPI003F9528E2
MITIEEQDRLTQIVHDLEANTAGEIVIVVANQAGGYRSIPLIWALLAALVTPWPLIWLTALSASRIFLIQLGVAIVLSFLLSLVNNRFALVPRVVKHARAHEAAHREFKSRGLIQTRERTGVLIYVAAAEHYAEIIADIGIAARVDQNVWNDIVHDLVTAIGEGRVAEGLDRAVQRTGSILAEHAPPRIDETNELPNRVIMI